MPPEAGSPLAPPPLKARGFRVFFVLHHISAPSQQFVALHSLHLLFTGSVLPMGSALRFEAIPTGELAKQRAQLQMSQVDTRSLQGCCKLFSGAGGHVWLSRRSGVTELFLGPSKTQVKGCAGPRHGPAMLGSKGCSGSALPRHHGGDLPPLRSPWGKNNNNNNTTERRCNQIKNKIK